MLFTIAFRLKDTFFNPNESKYIVLFTKQTVKKIHIK